jgi:predicted DNA-binding protein (UPF0251 family)
MMINRLAIDFRFWEHVPKMKDKRANAIVDRAIKRGELDPGQKCEQCSRTLSPTTRRRMIWAHHDDYSTPLVVRWLCPSCHRKVHQAPKENYLPIRNIRKLSTEEIEEIRYLHKIGLSRAFIADEIGCGLTTIWRVLKGHREARSFIGRASHA